MPVRRHGLLPLALDDVAWLLRLVGWVRGEAQLRSAALMIAAEGAAARLAAGEHGGNRALATAAAASGRAG